MKPIILPPGADVKPNKPETMKDLLDRADHDWKFKRKDEAFVMVLNGLALMSEGVAQCMKQIEALNTEIEQLKKRMDEYESNDLADQSAVPVSERSQPDSPAT